MNRGIKGPLNKFTDNTKLCGVVYILEGQDAFKEDPDSLERLNSPSSLNHAEGTLSSIIQIISDVKQDCTQNWCRSPVSGVQLDLPLPIPTVRIQAL
ncbi:hypothetical protein WISP_121217 [Willisornis vidua]|uniref:Uncharacterized protein n=1 Tax=Willisornis vidua TaxID=1566151 RepID=A0ABQ9CYI0_9PASS|nr:hypothetical protein WISP_121217 [Willisornis vidua]